MVFFPPNRSRKAVLFRAVEEHRFPNTLVSGSNPVSNVFFSYIFYTSNLSPGQIRELWSSVKSDCLAILFSVA
jgi:hypothetical protein